MSALRGKDLRERWIANAQSLDQRGHFTRYSSKQREEVLRKGFLGRYPPDQAINIARTQAEQAQAYRTPKFNDELRAHFGLVGAEVGDILLKVLDETPPESYEPPFELNEPPGCPFHFRSSALGCEVFFKFQIIGSAQKPRVVFWSCHPPLY